MHVTGHKCATLFRRIFYCGDQDAIPQDRSNPSLLVDGDNKNKKLIQNFITVRTVVPNAVWSYMVYAAIYMDILEL